MTSERKIAANRLNAKKSRGPRTAAGKFLASRNALRHGLRAVTHRQPTPWKKIERFAKAICGADNDPSLFEQACIIAENDFVLRAIHAQQLAVVERVREVTSIALEKGDNSLELAQARFLQAEQAYEVIGLLRDRLLLKYKDELPEPIATAGSEFEDDHFFPLHLRVFLLDKEEASDPAKKREPTDGNQAAERPKERDESAALEEAAPDLIRLDRYERRAWSRQKRAIREFMNMKLMRAAEAQVGAFKGAAAGS
jgi:hypothetical protein